PSSSSSMSETRPISTPRTLTLASGSSTRPLRGALTATATVWVNPPTNMIIDTVTTATMNSTRPSPASFSPSGPRSRAARPEDRSEDFVFTMPLSGEVEVAGSAVDGQRDQQRHRDHRDQGGAHRVTHRDTDAHRTARGLEAVVGVDHHHRD